VVLTQTPYNKADPAIPAAETYLVQRGYVQVITDVRGTGGSQGTWDSFGTREQRDGAEIVEWTASPQRSWSDGKVATFGASYMAINQLFTAAQHPRGLKAAFPIVPADDIYRDVVASGGQVDAGFIPLWLGLVTATGVLPPTSTGADPVMASGVMAAHLGGAGAFQLPTLMSSLTGGDLAYDGPFYRLRSPASVLDQVRVPTFVVGGWYDIFQRGEPLVYEQLRRNGVPTRLLMGPWTHVQTVRARNRLIKVPLNPHGSHRTT
jgi:putative CocE/NonD family hydrolase